MEIINEKYRMENTMLGSGGFSKVYLGTDLTTNQPIAIKMVDLTQRNLQNENALKNLKSEIIFMQNMNHPNIVKYYDVVKTSTNWYIIMECCSGMTIHDVIKFNDMMSKKKSLDFNREANTYYYLNQLKEALDYLRQIGCTHRDIKPMNILLTTQSLTDLSLSDSGTIFKSDSVTEEQIDQQPLRTRVDEQLLANKINESKLDYKEKLVVKLADFGLSRSYLDTEESLMKTICGSPAYMAPELFFNKEYNSKADLWAVGVIMYELLFGFNPQMQNAIRVEQIISNLKSQDINFNLNKNFTPNCFDLLKKLLQKNPDHRISWTDFFNHKWFTYWKNIIDNDENIFNFKNLRDSTNPILSEHQNYKNQNNTSTKNLLSLKNDLKSPSDPIRISSKHSNTNTNTNTNFSGNPSQKFLSQIGSPSSPSSPLGQSNLSRMKIDNFYPRSYTQGTYSDYPASYPPLDMGKMTSKSLVMSNKLNTKPIPIPKESIGTNNLLLSGKSLSFGTNNSLSKSGTSRSRIFKNFDSVGKTNGPIPELVGNSSTEFSNEKQSMSGKLDLSSFVVTDYDCTKTSPIEKSKAIADSDLVQQGATCSKTDSRLFSDTGFELEISDGNNSFASYIDEWP